MEVDKSKIKKYLSQYQTFTSQLQNQFKVNSNPIHADIALYKIKALKQIAQGYIKFILSQYVSLTQQINISDILTKLNTHYQIKGDNSNLLLAYTIKQQILKNPIMKSIQNKIVQLYQQKQRNSEQSESIDISIDDSRQQEKKIEKIENVYNKDKQIDISLTETNKSSTIINIDFNDNSSDVFVPEFDEDQENFNSDYFKNQNIQVRDYLYKLSKSTTELNYLCQRMKWCQPQFVQKKSKINQVLYACKVSVNVRAKKHFFQLYSICSGAVSKKQAKRVASLFLLRKIYNRIPQAWIKFLQSKKKNPMIQLELNANNEQIFKKEKFDILDPSVFKDEQQKTQKCQISKKINAYLDQIKSFKAEMNLVIGRFKKITPPQIKPQKQDPLSLWPVTIQIYDEDGTKLHFYTKEVSKKKAEQACCRQLLFQLYKRNIPRWQQFAKYKKQKNL